MHQRLASITCVFVEEGKKRATYSVRIEKHGELFLESVCIELKVLKATIERKVDRKRERRGERRGERGEIQMRKRWRERYR